MKRISILKNPILEYAWGSRTAIPELLGTEPSDTPQAELWMGAHPKAPSEIRNGSQWESLLTQIENDPADILGSAVARKFGNRLPYLFKVLAAAEPLSVQAHPSREQAREGFARENRLGIPMTAPNRNYKDDNHKPECICALTPFWALNGFRNIPDMLWLMGSACPRTLADELAALGNQPDSDGLRAFFHTLMTLTPERHAEILAEALDNAQMLAQGNPIFKWLLRLSRAWPNDIGVLSPLFLNLVCLEPGQAMFLPSGELHAYLDGVGIELMANSDNVLRGGLTPKHVDVPELLRVLSFAPRELEILLPERVSAFEGKYPTAAEEFDLSVIMVREADDEAAVFTNSGAEILLCTDGAVRISGSGDAEELPVGKGTSVFIPARVREYRISGQGTLYRAAVSP
ncbi:mannose-6-phosphate isomerase, class I [Desulfonema ishimotonii]|uniref:mannose-6-phosphate isomerase n=1 Tax=Desulfonema ishimotonii TaxID=45657 RepID=A0A401FW63_9BACT|nr:mannose-6-phosphate isomerase, class I [Desulfonema ishimotonii]GBC61206.1 mannose-6-phosphate isomerase, class I [Desulfonema ishimotonii]